MREIIIQNLKLVLVLSGVVLLAVGNTFHRTIFKVDIDHLLAEIGALLLVVGFLHFLFELRLRQEMIREISFSILGNERLHASGLIDCLLSSREVKEPAHWEAAASLTIGLQYSPRFVEDFHPVLRRRAIANRPTIVLVMNPDSAAAQYLRDSKTGIADVSGGVERIKQIIDEANGGLTNKIAIRTHDRVLRYSFIRTDESIWIKFYANSNQRVTIPALKVNAGTPLYTFFNEDIERLLTQE